MGAREPVVPGKFIFVPHRPKETQKKSSSGKNVTRAAQKHLPGRRRFAGKADDFQASHHHSRSCAAEDGEEGEILQINDGKGRGVNGRVQLTKRKLAAERAKKHQESAISKQQAAKIDQRREASIVDGCHGMKPRQTFSFVLGGLYLRACL